MPKARKGRKPAPQKASKRKPASTSRRRGERERLLKGIAEALHIGEVEAELRALRELAERVAPQQPRDDSLHEAAEQVHDQTRKLETQIDRAHELAEQAHVRATESRAKAQSRSVGPLPQRLYLLLDGRGLDGRGMPVEVIDTAVVGSGRQCHVWVNSPQIETRHLQFGRDEEGWYVEDLGSEHGTFLGDERISLRRVQDGDEYRLAGYLRVRAEIR